MSGDRQAEIVSHADIECPDRASAEETFQNALRIALTNLSHLPDCAAKRVTERRLKEASWWGKETFGDSDRIARISRKKSSS